MSLFSCPIELLEQIIGELAGDDLEHLTSTCKLLRRLAGPTLKQHYKLKRKYNHKINYPGRKAIHPVQLLDAIVKNPRTATYIKSLSLTYHPVSEGLARNAASFQKEYKRQAAMLEEHDYFWSLLVDNPFIADGERSSWYNGIQEGHLDGLFALLLYFLHNLQELRIDRPILRPLTFVMIARLKSSVGHKALEELHCSNDDYSTQRKFGHGTHSLGLAKLTRVILDPATDSTAAYQRGRMTDFARFASFSSFPELQSLHGISLSTRKYSLDQSFSGFPNLRSIRLVNCNIALESFHSLLSGIKALESFHYVPTAEVEEITQVVDDLKKYAGHSLKKLYLRHTGIETRVEGWKYRGFEQLKMIDLDWRCLVHYEEPVAAVSSLSHTITPSTTSGPPTSPKKVIKQDGKVQHPLLAHMMPATVESIKIVDLDGKANLEAIRWLFFKLAMSMRISRFPNLKVVIFVTPRQDCWLHAKNICSQAGLKFPTYSCEKERRISGLDFVYE